MGKISCFEIRFANQEGVFTAGQVLRGKVVLQLKGSMKMKGINFHLVGQSGVKWQEHDWLGAGKRKTYRNSEIYFNHQQLLYGKERGDSGTLEAGDHQFEFEFPLSANCPTTFEAMHGGIRYFAKATIQRPWKFDVNTKQPFTVINNFDLNTLTAAMDPQIAEKEYRPSGFCECWGSRPLQIEIRTDRRAYVPGETIRIDAELDNQSTSVVAWSKVILRQYVSFNGANQGVLGKSTKTKTTFHDIAELKHGRVGRKKRDVWEGEQCHLPCIPPSDLHGCSFIDTKYVLRFLVKVDDCCSTKVLLLELPIIIGTIPLAAGGLHGRLTLTQEHFATLDDDGDLDIRASPPGPSSPCPVHAGDIVPIVAAGELASAPPAPPPVEPSAPPLAIPGTSQDMCNIAPPSYEECIFGATDTRDELDNQYTMGKTKYTPRYPCYSSSGPDHPPQQ